MKTLTDSQAAQLRSLFPIQSFNLSPDTLAYWYVWSRQKYNSRAIACVKHARVLMDTFVSPLLK